MDGPIATATATVIRLLEDDWLCMTCCWVSFVVPSALHGWMVLLENVLRDSLGPCRTRGFRTRGNRGFARSTHLIESSRRVRCTATRVFFTSSLHHIRELALAVATSQGDSRNDHAGQLIIPKPWRDETSKLTGRRASCQFPQELRRLMMLRASIRSVPLSMEWAFCI